MMEATKQKTIFHGHTTKNFRSVELQGFITCFSCGQKKGPLPVKYDREFEYEDECQFAEDSGFVLGLVSGSEKEDNIIMALMCIPCVTKFDLPFENPVFRK